MESELFHHFRLRFTFAQAEYFSRGVHRPGSFQALCSISFSFQLPRPLPFDRVLDCLFLTIFLTVFLTIFLLDGFFTGLGQCFLDCLS